jgi:hypothetical protein
VTTKMMCSDLSQSIALRYFNSRRRVSTNAM